MATDKKRSFVMYEQWSQMIAKLPDEQALQLARAICCHKEGIDYEISDPVIAIYFDSVKEQMDSDDQKYREKCERLSQNSSKADLEENKSGSKENKSGSKENKSGGDNDNENDNVSPSEIKRESRESGKRSSTSRPPRHKHGEYGHVMLTEEQYASLVSSHGQDETDKAITCVDEYCEQTGKAYKNYKIVLEKWGYKSAKETRAPANRGQPTGKPNRFHNFAQGDYDMDALEKALIKN